MNFFKKIVVAILTIESRLILKKYKPFIVAVTGSVGKTSTKDAIYAVLKGQNNFVRKSEKSMNSDIGLPLTVIGVPNAWRSFSGWYNNIIKGAQLIFTKKEYPDCLILEIGADHPGDIEDVAKWLRPDISVITQIGSMPVHVEFFISPEDVFEEKATLATAVKKGGTLILFADNQKVMSLTERVKEKNVKVISFGTAENANVKGSELKVVYGLNEVTTTSSLKKNPSGFRFKLDMNGTSNEVSINGILGTTYMYPLLAAAAVGIAQNVPIPTIVHGLNSYDAPKGRMKIIEGINDSTLIDDTYNSSPDAVISALKTLKELECSGVKIVALGDMLELGQYSADEHRRIGREVASIANVLVTVGQRSRATADEAVNNGFDHKSVHSFNTSVEAGEYLRPIVKSGDIVLIKGSQSIRMERTVCILMKNPEQATRLLVRQEKQWLLKK